MASAAVATEQSPLLERVQEEAGKHLNVLVQVIGARHLPSEDPLLEPYCAVQFGTKTIHKTKVSHGIGIFPIWTLETNSLFIVSVCK